MTNRSLKTRPCRLLFCSVLLVCLALTVPGCNWIKQVSVSSAGEPGYNDSYYNSLSADGRFVVFSSAAANLVPNDTGYRDIFVHDTLNGTTSRVSVDSAGNQGNSFSYYAAISGDGRYVAFDSNAGNLVAGDTIGWDIFVHDRTTGTTSLVSVDSAGNRGNSSSQFPSISRDGRYVAFESAANNLVAGDTNSSADIFVHDRTTGITSRVSANSAGIQGNGNSFYSAISGDGRYVSFISRANNLVAGDTNNEKDIFVRDRTTGTTTRVSVDSAGNQGSAHNLADSFTAISDDGRFVAFTTDANNLVAGDTNGQNDIFVRDRATGTTTRVSVNSAGNQGNAQSYQAALSGDGRYVVFDSAANNLVAGDTANRDIFVHDRTTGTTTRVSTDASGTPGLYLSFGPSISSDGRYVGFISASPNLVPDDTINVWKVFIKAIPEVTVTSVTPDDLPVGVTTAVTISGTNFLPGATPLLSGAQLSNIVIVNENTITANVAVNADTPLGAETLSVGLPGTGPGPLTGSFADCIDCVTFTPPPGC